MIQVPQGVVLVGHGGIPKDYPRNLVLKLKRLEGERRASGGNPTPQEIELDTQIRRWPRTPETDPYKAGLETLAKHFQTHLDGQQFRLAYNEFCAPTLEEAVEDLISSGARHITVVSSMFTPGGLHSEVEIPETLEHIHQNHPSVVLRYAWPFDLGLIAAMLAQHLKQFS